MNKPVLLMPQFRRDLVRLRHENPKLLAKLWDLVADLTQNPFTGLGLPEALKENLSGLWSRRINQEHRLVYEIQNDVIYLHGCYGHY